VSRIARILLLAAIALLTQVPAAARAESTKKLDDYLSSLWTTVLETPSAENPFGTGGADFACFNLGGTVAPFAPGGVESCTVKPGTRLFVVAASVECSTFEDNGTTDAELRTCARDADAQVAPAVTIDGRTVPIAEVETPLLNIILPADNIFGPTETPGLSVAHGWVALLHPLTPGTHTVFIDVDDGITTEIVVQPGR
jgi:hypothetical protein